jgi:hypothetical protein
LKSFGNLGQATEEAEKQIVQCLKNKKTDPAIRVAAADAFRRMSCSKAVSISKYLIMTLLKLMR